MKEGLGFRVWGGGLHMVQGYWLQTHSKLVARNVTLL